MNRLMDAPVVMDVRFTRNPDLAADDERYGAYRVHNCPQSTDIYLNDDEHLGNAALFKHAGEMFELLRQYEWTDSAVAQLLALIRTEAAGA